jgi:ABC-type proline/glycine betaine transport system ATPase subunit
VLKDAVETYHKTVILVTHDIDEAVALSKRVVVLSGRPARVKIVHDIEISAPSPIAARGDSRFSGYFHALRRTRHPDRENRLTVTMPVLTPCRSRSAPRPRAALQFRHPARPRGAAGRSR